MKLTEKKAEKIKARIEELVLAEVVKPCEWMPFRKESLAHEIAKRIVDNWKLADSRAQLQKQVLIVLNDYRDHEWVNQKKMQSEVYRLGLMERICA